MQLETGALSCPRTTLLGPGLLRGASASVPDPSLARPQFEIDDVKGPVLEQTIRTMEQVKQLHAIDFSKVDFVGK